MCESFFIVYAFILGKTLNNKSCLYRSTLSFELCLVLNIHLQPTDFAPSGNSTISQTLLLYIDFISSFIPSIHFSEF
jgi:hypothetical protein